MELKTVTETAKLLGCHRATIYNMIKQKKIKCHLVPTGNMSRDGKTEANKIMVEPTEVKINFMKKLKSETKT